MFKVVRSKVMAGLVVATALLIAACGSDDSPDTGGSSSSGPESSDSTESSADTTESVVTDPRIEASKEEGAVLIYGNPPQEFWDELIPKFNEEYPWIDVETVDLDSADLVQRYLSEEATGTGSADIIVDTSSATWATMVAEGAVAEYEMAGVPERGVVSPGVFVLEWFPGVIVYNKVVLSEDEYPTSMADLIALADANPGKVTTYDAQNEPGYSFAWSWVEKAGWDTFDQLLPNTTPETSGGAMAQKMGQGEYLAGFFQSGLIRGLLDDLGLEDLLGWSYPSDGLILLPRAMAITASSDSPSSAQLLMDYMISEAGQAVVCEIGMNSYRDEIADQCGFASVADAVASIGEENVWFMRPSDKMETDREEFQTRWDQTAGR